MSSITLASGITLEYDETGSPHDPALLLIMGFGAQMTEWPAGFVQRLADLGRRVIRFDNRDCGLSHKLDGVTVDMGMLMGDHSFKGTTKCGQ